MAPTMPNAAPPLVDGALENLPGLFRHVDRVGERSLFEPRVAIRMSTGSTEVKNWAAIVIDRSNTSIRPSPAAARRSDPSRPPVEQPAHPPLQPGRQTTQGGLGPRPGRILGRPGGRQRQALRAGSRVVRVHRDLIPGVPSG